VTGAFATQPYNQILWPHEVAAVGAPMVWDPQTAMRIPAVARAVQLYTGQIKQAPMDAYRGVQPLPRPRLLEQPDPNCTRAWFTECLVQDYLCEGNAVSYVTARDPMTGWPTATTWIPAAWLSITCPPRDWTQPEYWLGGVKLPRDNVVHVKRGADRYCPARGVSIVEQHLATLDRVAAQEEYERQNLREGSVPSAAVITPNQRLGRRAADQAKVDWLDKFIGPGRRPAILPAGTQVIPLGWSPADSQMEQARKMSLTDVANVLNLDGYWLGAPTTSLTYRSPGPMYTHLLKISLGPVLTDFEQTWSIAWLPRGQQVVFDRVVLQRDDFATTVDTITKATGADPPLMSVEEGRTYMGLAPTMTGGVSTTSPVATEPVEEQ
jgi:HK97 family phage portal protein